MTTRAGHSDSFTTDDALEAECEAPEADMASDESRTGSEGETMTAFVPHCQCESGSAYGLRAAGEILSRYLADEER